MLGEVSAITVLSQKKICKSLRLSFNIRKNFYFLMFRNQTVSGRTRSRTVPLKTWIRIALQRPYQYLEERTGTCNNAAAKDITADILKLNLCLCHLNKNYLNPCYHFIAKIWQKLAKKWKNTVYFLNANGNLSFKYAQMTLQGKIRKNNKKRNISLKNTKNKTCKLKQCDTSKINHVCKLEHSYILTSYLKTVMFKRLICAELCNNNVNSSNIFF